MENTIIEQQNDVVDDTMIESENDVMQTTGNSDDTIPCCTEEELESTEESVSVADSMQSIASGSLQSDRSSVADDEDHSSTSTRTSSRIVVRSAEDDANEYKKERTYLPSYSIKKFNTSTCVLCGIEDCGPSTSSNVSQGERVVMGNVQNINDMKHILKQLGRQRVSF